MVFIKIEGADQVIAMEFSNSVQRSLAKRLGIKEEELVFVTPESFFVHGGQEQTSFHVLVEVLLPKDLKPKEKDVVELLQRRLHEIAIHSHIVFTYFDSESEYDEIDHDYPDYMDNTNMVKAETEQDDQDEEGAEPEPYMGNVFQELDDFVAAHPELSKDQATIEYYKEKNEAKKDGDK